MFDAGDIQASLTLDRTPFQRGLRQARTDAEAFERKAIEAKVDLDLKGAEAQLVKFTDEPRTIHADLDLDTGAAEVKVAALRASAAGIGGGGIGAGGGGRGGAGGGGGFFGAPGSFIASHPLAAAIGVGAPLLPTVGASLVQGTLGLGALGAAGAGAGAIGGAGIIGAAIPAVTQLKKLTEAQKGYDQAVATYGRTSTQAATAQKKLNAAQEASVPAAEEVQELAGKIADRWRHATIPAQATFFRTLKDGLETSDNLLPMFARSADRSMVAARASLDYFFHALEGPDFRVFVHTMTDTFARSVGPLTIGLTNVLDIMGRIAVAAAPDFIHMMTRFAMTTERWMKATDDRGALRARVHGYIEQFRDWMGLIGAVGNLLGSIFITNTRGALAGEHAIERLTRTFNRWARWVDHHRGQVNGFFVTTLHTLETLLSASGQLVVALGPVAEAIIPISHGIHDIAEALNSIKIGNVSALTVLLGLMVGRSLGGKIFGGAAAAAAGGAGGSALGRLAGSAGAGVGGGIAARFGAKSLGELATRLPFGGAAVGAGAAVAVQSLAGKPGSFLGPGIAGFAPDEDELKRQYAKDLHIQRVMHGKSLDQLIDLRYKTERQWRLAFEEAPADAMSQGQKALSRQAHRTIGQINNQIKAVRFGSRIAEAIAEGGGDVHRIVKRYKDEFDKIPTSAQEAAIASAKKQLDQLERMGLITKRQERRTLRELEAMHKDSQRRQRLKFDEFGRGISRLTATWFGSALHTVQTILGNRGMTGAVNQLLTGVGSQRKLKFNATTLGAVAGHLLPALMGGGEQRGGFSGRLPGYGTHDDQMKPLRGGEAVLRPEDHVPIVSRALQATYGFDLGGLFSRTGSSRGTGTGFAGGGFAGMQSGITGLIQGMMHKFGGVLSSGLRVGDSGFHGRGLAGDYVPSNWAGAARYANQIGPELLEGIYTGAHGGPAVSWDSGSQVSHSFWGADWAPHSTHIHLAIDHMVKGAVGAAIRRLIPRIAVHGPDGALRDGIQGAADLARSQANAMLRRLQRRRAPTGDVTGPAPFKGGGQFMSTAYGPPWGGIQGTGVTATGINLSDAPHRYLVAVDPSVIPLHSQLRIWPNPFGYRGKFGAEDTGGAIQGNRLDFYDWRGRGAQLGWGERMVHVQGRHRGGRVRPGEVSLLGEKGIELGVGRKEGGADIVSNEALRRLQRPDVHVHNHFAPGMEWLERFIDTRVEVGVDGQNDFHRQRERMRR